MAHPIGIAGGRHNQVVGVLRIPQVGITRKAGIVFNVDKIAQIICKILNIDKEQVSDFISIYLAVVIEYLCAEIYALAGNVTRNEGRVRIEYSDIVYAIQKDNELNVLLGKNCEPIVEQEISFQTWSYKVLKQVHPDAGITKQGDITMDIYLNIIINKIICCLCDIDEYTGKQTIPTIDDMIKAVKDTFGDSELAVHAHSEGTKAINRFKNYGN